MTDNPLDKLEETGLVAYSEDGLPSKTDSSRHLHENEICHLMLPHIVENLKISNRELARRIGVDPRSVGKYRSSDTFLQLLAEYSNKRMISVRALAIDVIEKMLLDDKLSPATKAKYAQLALNHSEKWTEIMLQAKGEKKINVSDLMRELEDM